MELLTTLQNFYSQFALDEQIISWRGSPYLHVIPLVSGVLYVALVQWFPGFLIRRGWTGKAGWISPTMAGWNLFLCVLSFCMFLGIAIPSLQFYSKWGWWQVVCDEERKYYEPGVVVIWLATFGYSKYFELMDTFFLILKNPKREVAFLHWYHHLTVMWFTWYASNWRLTAGMVFAGVNSLIHSFMYWYYFQMERGHQPSWAKILTIGQIAQMILGLVVNVIWAWGYLSGYGCACDKPDVILIMGIAVYASYLFLFLKFFMQKYLSPSARTPKLATKKPVKVD